MIKYFEKMAFENSPLKPCFEYKMSRFLEVVHQREYWNCDLVPFHFQLMQFQQNDFLMNLCLFKDSPIMILTKP